FSLFCVSNYIIRTKDLFLPCEASSLFQQVSRYIFLYPFLTLSLPPQYTCFHPFKTCWHPFITAEHHWNKHSTGICWILIHYLIPIIDTNNISHKQDELER